MKESEFIEIEQQLRYVRNAGHDEGYESAREDHCIHEEEQARAEADEAETKCLEMILRFVEQVP